MISTQAAGDLFTPSSAHSHFWRCHKSEGNAWTKLFCVLHMQCTCALSATRNAIAAVSPVWCATTEMWQNEFSVNVAIAGLPDKNINGGKSCFLLTALFNQIGVFLFRKNVVMKMSSEILRWEKLCCLLQWFVTLWKEIYFLQGSASRRVFWKQECCPVKHFQRQPPTVRTKVAVRKEPVQEEKYIVGLGYMCVCCHPDNVWKWESLTKFKWHWVFPNSCLFPVWAFMILVKAVTFPDTSRWLPSLHHIFPLVDNCCSSDSIASVFNAKEHGGFTKRLPLTTCHLPCRNHQAGSFWNPDSFDEWRQRSSSTDNPVPASGVCLLQRLHWCQAGFSNCGEATAAQHQQFGVGWCEWFSGQAPMSTSLTLWCDRFPSIILRKESENVRDSWHHFLSLKGGWHKAVLRLGSLRFWSALGAITFVRKMKLQELTQKQGWTWHFSFFWIRDVFFLRCPHWRALHCTAALETNRKGNSHLVPN